MRSWVSLLLAVSLMHSCESQGPRVTTVFVQTGDDLLLNVDDVPEDSSFVDWKYNKTVVLVRFSSDGKQKVSPDFTGRLEFPVKKFSVKLKNLQKADSGVYTARVIAFDGDQQLAEYKVTVQDPVSPVELSVVPVVSRSSASCNLTATCSTQDSLISSTFTCISRTCSQEGGEQAEVTTSGASLRVHLLNGSIICHHGNKVNSTEDVKMIEHVCYPDAEDTSFSEIVICFMILTPVGGVLIILAIIYYRKKQNSKRDSMENTVYDIPLAVAAHQHLDQRPTDDDSGLSPTSTYSLVGPHTGTALPESLYAQVEKPARSLNN